MYRLKNQIAECKKTRKNMNDLLISFPNTHVQIKAKFLVKDGEIKIDLEVYTENYDYQKQDN